MPNVKREPAVIAAIEPGEWLTQREIHRRLGPECRCQMNAEKATSYTCRRLAKAGKLQEKIIKKPEERPLRMYALPEEEA